METNFFSAKDSTSATRTLAHCSIRRRGQPTGSSSFRASVSPLRSVLLRCHRSGDVGLPHHELVSLHPIAVHHLNLILIIISVAPVQPAPPPGASCAQDGGARPRSSNQRPPLRRPHQDRHYAARAARCPWRGSDTRLAAEGCRRSRRPAALRRAARPKGCACRRGRARWLARGTGDTGGAFRPGRPTLAASRGAQTVGPAARHHRRHRRRHRRLCFDHQ